MKNLNIIKKAPFIFVDIAHIPNQPYSKLVILKSYDADITKVQEKLDNDFSGRILIDCLFSLGNNSNRFIEARIENGKMVYTSVLEVKLDRKAELRVLSNKIIALDPEGMDAGVLLSHQKALLSKGISI